MGEAAASETPIRTDASLLEAVDCTSHTVTVGTEDRPVDLHVVAAGAADGPLVVLLHGFPEFWYGWRHQLPALVEAGYRVLVPDQRGYNLSDKPAGLDAYRISRLSGDVADLVEWAGRERAHVVGHDWGASVAWDLALRDPGVVDRLVTCNTPHPTAFRETLPRSLRQLRRSWYVLWFQLPRLPEWILARNGAAAVADSLASTSAPGTFSEAELATYRAAWLREGTARAAIDWYRAAARRPEEPPRTTVEAPTLVVWGDRDVALVPELADRSLAYCADGRLERFPEATHWVQHEAPERVGELVVEHLSG